MRGWGPHVTSCQTVSPMSAHGVASQERGMLRDAEFREQTVGGLHQGVDDIPPLLFRGGDHGAGKFFNILICKN
jgi:hypothetical protein